MRHVRPFRVVARAALIAVLASVAVSSTVGSRPPSRDLAIDPEAFAPVDLDALAGTAWTTTLPLPDPASAARDVLEPGDVLLEPAPLPAIGAAPPAHIREADPLIVNRWRYNPDESWYGPGFYGEHTACGQVLTKTLMGVANRTLPCGTLVSFRNPYNGRVVTVPVVDRGPYVAGRDWDLTHGACLAIDHCWTGPLQWRLP
jgi:hypothetical protein